MKINSRPPDPLRTTPDAGAEGAKAPKGGKAFELQGEAAHQLSKTMNAQFSASDLDRPESAAKAVRASFGAMLEGQPVSGSLPGERREALADFMAADPILHQKMLTYLRKTLT